MRVTGRAPPKAFSERHLMTWCSTSQTPCISVIPIAVPSQEEVEQPTRKVREVSKSDCPLTTQSLRLHDSCIDSISQASLWTFIWEIEK